MKQFNLTTILIIIILGLLVYLAFKPSNDKKYLNLIEQQNNEIIKQREANLDSMKKWFEGIELVERKEVFIRNFYNEVISGIDTVSTFGGMYIRIREKLDTLGSARLD